MCEEVPCLWNDSKTLLLYDCIFTSKLNNAIITQELRCISIIIVIRVCSRRVCINLAALPFALFQIDFCLFLLSAA